MPVQLSQMDQEMLDGRHGPAARLAMRVMVRMAEVYGAEEMMDITQAHIDGVGLLSDSGLEFAETLSGWGGKVRVPTTLNMVPLDAQHWREQGVPEALATKALRQIQAYVNMGCIPTCSCAPYQGYLTPRFGQQIAWGESNAIVYANSVLGARTNRYGDYVDICAALTGRVPKSGLHLKENRKGQLLLRLVDIPPRVLRDDSLYPALGYLLGKVSEDQVPVIQGLPADVTRDQLKALGAASASSGAVALFHAVGVTPEAATLEEAFQGGPPEQVMDIHLSDLAAARDALSTAEAGIQLDAVIVGCPHFSFNEFQQLARLVQAHPGQRVHHDVLFLVFTEQGAHSLAQRSGLLDIVTGFGVQIVHDTCVFHSPVLPPSVRVVMTNSGKNAYYAPGELGVQVAFGSLADCVRSAIAGRVVREEATWSER
jgi:predicted aconitase